MELNNKNIIYKKKNNLEYLQFKNLLQYPELKHAYVIGLDKTFKIYSNPSVEEKEKNEIAIKSYKKICEELNINYNNIVNTKQNHTDNIKIINEKINKNEPDFNMYEDTDGLITNKTDIILSTINADCILFIFYDPKKGVIANIHSGWRGTTKRISVKTVKMMQEKYNCNPKDIICCISPCIRKDHFEVDEDVFNIFKNEFVELSKIVWYQYNREKNKYNIDTVLVNKEILMKEGIEEKNIIDSEICSVCNKDKIHSYRAYGEKAGRSTLIISIKK